MDVIRNQELWSKAGFVVFEERDDAVQFWNACKSRDIAVQGGRVVGQNMHRYYVARDIDTARQRVADYALWLDELIPCFEPLPYEFGYLK